MNIQRAGLAQFLAQGMGSIIKIFGLVYFARILGPKTIGIFFLYTAILSIATTVSDLDIGAGITKRISEGGNRDTFLWTGVTLTVFPITVVTGSILLFNSSINGYIGAELSLLLALHIILSVLGKLLAHVLTGQFHIAQAGISQLSQEFFFVSSGFLLLQMGYGVTGLVFALVIGTTIKIIYLIFKISPKLSKPTMGSARDLFDFFRYSFLTSTGNSIFSWIDVLLIGAFLSQSDVGIYEIPWRITAVFLLLSRAITTAIFPQISKWNENNLLDNIEALVTRSISVSLFLTVPAVVGTIVVGYEVLIIVFGGEYNSSWSVLIIVGMIRLVEAVDIIIAQTIEALDHPKKTFKTEYIAMGVNIVLNIVFIWFLGILGAALASVIAISLRTVLNGQFLQEYISIRFPIYQFYGMIFASSVMALGVEVVSEIFTIDSFSKLIALITFAVVIYFSCAVAIRPLRTMIRENIKKAAF